MTDKKSYDRTYAIVNLDRMEENLRLCKNSLREGIAFCAVIKMDAYGHGMVEVAKAVEEECALFGVATIEEAITLRKAGIEKNILVLGVVPESQYTSLFDYRVMPSLFTSRQLDKIEKIAEKRKKVYRRNKSEQSQQLFLLVNAFHVKLGPVFKF